MLRKNFPSAQKRRRQLALDNLQKSQNPHKDGDQKTKWDERRAAIVKVLEERIAG